MFRELSHKMGPYLYCEHIKKYFNHKTDSRKVLS